MYSRILVTLDQSRLSEAVLPQVGRLAAGNSARITLLTVANPPKGSLSGLLRREPQALTTRPSTASAVGRGRSTKFEQLDHSFEPAKDGLDEYLEEKAATLRGQGLQVDTIVRFGDPVQEIIDYAWNHGIELILMATHGRTGLQRLMCGSVAGRVVAKSSMKPVLLVRPDDFDAGAAKVAATEPPESNASHHSYDAAVRRREEKDPWLDTLS